MERFGQQLVALRASGCSAETRVFPPSTAVLLSVDVDELAGISGP